MAIKAGALLDLYPRVSAFSSAGRTVNDPELDNLPLSVRIF